MMNMMIRLLVTAALALASVSTAHATSRVDTVAFSIVDQWGASPDMLLYNSNGLTRIGLSSAASSLGAYTSRYSEGNFYAGLFEVTVHAGYYVTGFAFSGTFEGALDVASNPNGTPGNGYAFNSGNIEFSAGSRPYGVFYGEHTQRVDMLDGAVPFTMSSGHVSLATDFNLSLQGLIMVSAYPSVTPQYPSGIDSFASLRVANPMLTIYTSAVPEPASYGMLLAGVAVIGLVRRRRQLP
ncbi:VPLPA-CTERM sorting domain-containing protein [Massilia sp. H27-R4]|nr:VPLPA-CTERM sorting domain-containing protein [Massilia sp. H27-R4]